MTRFDADEDDGDDDRVQALFMAGFSLSADEAARLLAQVENDPDDLDTRLKLVSHFHFAGLNERASRAAHLALVEWLVSRHPDAVWAGSFPLEVDQHLDPHGFASVKALWLRQVDAHPTSGRVRANAAAFLDHSDDAEAVRLLEEAKSLEPNEAEWPMRLGQIHGRQLMPLDGEERRNLAKLALAEHERSVALTGDDMQTYFGADPPRRARPSHAPNHSTRPQHGRSGCEVVEIARARYISVRMRLVAVMVKDCQSLTHWRAVVARPPGRSGTRHQRSPIDPRWGGPFAVRPTSLRRQAQQCDLLHRASTRRLSPVPGIHPALPRL